MENWKDEQHVPNQKNWKWTQLLATDKQFLFLIRYPSCYSHGQFEVYTKYVIKNFVKRTYLFTFLFMQCAPIYVYDVMTINEISIFKYIIGSWRNCQKEESKPTLQVSILITHDKITRTIPAFIIILCDLTIYTTFLDHLQLIRSK
jgi:hypothetical protein